MTDGEGGSSSESVRVISGGPFTPFITVNEPDAGETVSIRRPFTIEWDAAEDPDGPPIETFDVWSSSDDGETWRRIDGCSDLPPTARWCQWAAPSPAATHSFIRVVANRAGSMVGFNVSGRFSVVSGPGSPSQPSQR